MALNVATQVLVEEPQLDLEVCKGAVRQKVVKEGWWDDGSLWDPCPNLAGRRNVTLVETIFLPNAEVCHKLSNQMAQ